MDIPPICIIEAKQDNFEEGWTQALAKMVATSLQGRTICYSAVTSGNIWEFGYLKDQRFTKDSTKYSATLNLQEIFDILNWIFNVANPHIENEQA